jgi:hypothetical protein
VPFRALRNKTLPTQKQSTQVQDTGEYAGCPAAFSDSTIAAPTSPPPVSPLSSAGGEGGDGTAKTENFTTTTPSSVVVSMQTEEGSGDVVVLNPPLDELRLLSSVETWVQDSNSGSNSSSLKWDLFGSGLRTPELSTVRERAPSDSLPWDG